MQGTLSPYDILGISHEADLEQIRLAYRRGALKYHPDNYQGDPVEAEEMFRELARAYKAALRSYIPKPEDHDDGKAFSPAEIARMESKWHSFAIDGSYEQEPTSDWSRHQGVTKSRSIPTVDENKVFVCFWIFATVLGFVVAFSAGAFGMLGNIEGDMEFSDVLVLEGLAILTFAAVVAGTIIAIVLTRKTIWLTLQLGARLLPYLPRIHKTNQLPKAQPQDV